MSEADVEAPVLYIERTAQKPYAYEYEPPAGKPLRSAQYREHQVRIRNARQLRPPATLDRQGFELLRAPSSVRDFHDANEVRAVYYPELQRLVREATGATSAVVFDHTLRSSNSSGNGSAVKEPVSRVHNDYTPESALRRVRDVVPAQQAERLLAHRFLEVNVWRPIRGPVRTRPLAVLDSATVADSDYIATDLIYRDRRGEIYYVAHGPQHAWYYYPDMVPEEALLIKGFDSDAQRARFAAHAAFDDPRTPANAVPRESIEARLFAFFAPEEKVPSLAKYMVQFR